MENTGSPKFALVAQGGSTKCVEEAGVYHALAKIGFMPDIAYGLSGNAPNLAYYIAGQDDVLKTIWTGPLASKKFIDFKRFSRIIDVDYLVYDVLKGQFPLDEDSFLSSGTRLFVPSTSKETGLPFWFEKWQQLDIFRVLHAAMAVVGVYGKAVEIGGTNYVDVPSSHLVNLAIKDAVSQGATHILLLDRPKTTGLTAIASSAVFRYWLKQQTTKFQEGFLKSMEESQSFILPNNVFRMSSDPEASFFTKDSQKLSKLFERGFEKTYENKELLRFLKCRL